MDLVKTIRNSALKKRKQLEKQRHRQAVKRLRSSVSTVSDTQGVPAIARAPVPSEPQNMKLPIYYSDLKDRVPTEEDVNELIASFARRPTFFMLAMLNIFLSFYEKDREAFTYIQGFFFTNLVDDELFELAKERFGGEQMGARPMFHRQQMLVLIKKLLSLASEDGKYNPNDAATKDGRYALGRVALMTNDLLNSEEQALRLAEREGAENDRQRRYEELVTQMLPIYELSNPPEVIPGLVRSAEYFEIFKRKAEEEVFVFRNGDSVADRFLKLTGLPLDDYLLMILAVYLNYEAKARKDGAVKTLTENPREFNIGVDTIFGKMRFTPEERQAFFQQTTASLDGLAEACRIVKSKSALLHQYDFTGLRKYPLVYTRAENDIVTCLDLSFLAEKISTGVYYNIKQPLEERAKQLQEEGDEAASKIAANDHSDFLSYWGGVFDVYVNDRLREAEYRGGQSFFSNPYYDEPPAKTDREVFDAVLDCGETLVVFEHKGKYLELGAKYGGDREFFLADLKSDKRVGKGVYQLAENLEWVFDNRPEAKRRTFHERDGQGRRVKRFGLEDIARIKRIYPVIVHQDFSLRLNGVGVIMRELFNQQLAQRALDHDLVRPLSLMSVEDLEILLPYLVDVSISDVLEDYVDHDDPITTFQIIFANFRKSRGVEQRRNLWIDQRSDEIWKKIKGLFVDFSD